MALTAVVTNGVTASSVRAEKVANYVITITNGGSTAVTLQSLAVSCQGGDCVIAQPVYLTPNVPVGVGNPVFAASASASYGFQVVFPSPYFPGPSPQNPGGASPTSQAAVADPFYNLQIVGLSSDGSVFSTVFMVSVLSAMYPFPIPEGGGLIFTQGSNLMTLIMLGAL